MPDDHPKGIAPTPECATQRGVLKPANPCAMVLFGATGDLAKRLVIPALYDLANAGALPQRFALIGVAHGQVSLEDWRRSLHAALTDLAASGSGTFHADHIDEDVWTWLSDKMSFVPGDLRDPEVYQALHKELDRARTAHGTGGAAMFYLAVADRLFGPVIEQLGRAKLTDDNDGGAAGTRFWRRVVIEKPFGHSLQSARDLNAEVLKTLREDQIFRIDHFLGKDPVQTIMAFRFANGLFEPIWNRDRIDHVQITAAETIGVEQRGVFYEHAGALRDMAPNHLFSLLSLVAMEPPTCFDADAVLARKADVLAAIPALTPAKAVRGQYGDGAVGGKPVTAYRREPHVAADSKVETYVALEVEVDNWRWAGVPFYLRTGKRLARRMTEIAIRFKPAPHAVFRDTPVESLRCNWLVMRIAPDQGISLQFEVKRPGPAVELAAVKMQFDYDDWFPKTPNVGYETLLYDVMIGDHALFMSADIVEQGWRVVQPVLDAWAADLGDPPVYAAGSQGPKAADDLIARSGWRSWRPLGEAP
jgi:glucose-6-phosphate 1-dehydrogenase